MELNKEAGDIIGHYSRIKHYKVEGMVNIKRHLAMNKNLSESERASHRQ
jgi:hypothetical protein